jgi:hypothetical protein
MEKLSERAPFLQLRATNACTQNEGDVLALSGRQSIALIR